MSDDQLDYETHIRHYEKLYGGIHENIKTPTILRAQYDHALYVFNPLRDLQINAVTLSAHLKDRNALYYMLHGAGRRLRMIWDGYRSIIFSARPEREEGLSSDEQSSITRDINVIYMNLRGVLDNFAWCFAYEKEPELVNKLHRNAIGLFSKEMRKASKAINFWDRISGHDSWEKDVKERRDPVAHRIPLYVPPSIVTPEEGRLYSSLYHEHTEAVNEMDTEKADKLFARLERIGKFIPCFVHHPENGAVALYPTLPTDMAHLIRLYAIVEKELTSI